MSDFSGKPLRLNPDAPSASPDLPAFIAKPDDAPVYHGFALIEETRLEGWVFGTISDYEDPEGCEWGDAFVVAPDGSRAGLVWAVEEFDVEEVCPPDEDRWGVYSVPFLKPVHNTAEFVECCHAILPDLKRIHSELTKSNS